MAIQLPKFKLAVKNFVRRFSDDYINELVAKRMVEKAGGMDAGGVIRFRPQFLPLGNGGIEKPHPLGVTFQTLRDFADYYPIARACIEYRKSQITQLDWDIAFQDVDYKKATNEENQIRVKKIKKFFKYPTGKKDCTFTDWLKQMLEDMLVIDAVAIYRRRNRRGDIIGYLPIDGATIHLIVDPDGTTPEPPSNAYVQKIQGMEVARLTTDDLLYLKTAPKTYDPFGRAPIETLIITITTALKLQAASLAALTEGNVPSGFVTVPKDIASNRDQLKEWQDAWDAMLSGDPRFQQKLKFLPEGMKYEASVKQTDLTFERFEKWLLQNCCSVFGVQPNAIGFNFETNRSTSETSFEVGKERGLFPTALFVKEMMDRMVQDDLKEEDMEFRWTNINSTNKLEEANVVTKLVNGGLMSIDEWRIGENLKPTGAVDPFIMTPVGPIFVKDLAAQSKAGQMPILPYKPTSTSTPVGDNAGDGGVNLPGVLPQAKTKIEDNALRIEELRRWRRVAVNDWKRQKPLRDFKTDLLDGETQGIIKKQLEQAGSREEIEKVFTPFISGDGGVIAPLFDLYEELENVLDSRGVGETTANSIGTI